MVLTEEEIKKVLETAKAAFPNLTDWQFQNKPDHEHDGFTMWGEFVFNPEEPLPNTFFITLYTRGECWQGSLTIGRYSYWWSSTEEGDSYLIGTPLYDSLDMAIIALKAEIIRLFTALAGSN